MSTVNVVDLTGRVVAASAPEVAERADIQQAPAAEAPLDLTVRGFEPGIAAQINEANRRPRSFLESAFRATARAGVGGLAGDLVIRAAAPGRVDLRKHNAVGAAVGAVCGEYVMEKTGSQLKAAAASLGCAAAAGVAGEIAAPLTKGVRDPKDIAATALGGLMVGITYVIK